MNNGLEVFSGSEPSRDAPKNDSAVADHSRPRPVHVVIGAALARRVLHSKMAHLLLHRLDVTAVSENYLYEPC